MKGWLLNGYKLRMRPCFDSGIDVADRDRLMIDVFVLCFGSLCNTTNTIATLRSRSTVHLIQRLLVKMILR